MAVFSFSRHWKKVALFSLVLASAAVAGVWSEVLAQAPSPFRADFHGPSLVAHWDDFAGGVSSEAYVWVVGGFISSGRAAATGIFGNREATSFAEVKTTEWTGDGVVQVSARALIDPDDLFVERGLEFARLNAEIPGTMITWTPSEDWSNQGPVTVKVILELMGEGKAMHEDSLRRTSDPFSGDLTIWQAKGQVMQATGFGSILVDDEPLVPPNTATNWAETRMGQGSMQLEQVRAPN